MPRNRGVRRKSRRRRHPDARLRPHDPNRWVAGGQFVGTTAPRGTPAVPTSEFVMIGTVAVGRRAGRSCWDEVCAPGPPVAPGLSQAAVGRSGEHPPRRPPRGLPRQGRPCSTHAHRSSPCRTSPGHRLSRPRLSRPEHAHRSLVPPRGDSTGSGALATTQPVRKRQRARRNTSPASRLRNPMHPHGDGAKRLPTNSIGPAPVNDGPVTPEDAIAESDRRQLIRVRSTVYL